MDREVRAAPRLTPAGERILAAASTLFYEQGIRTVGVDAIAAAADVTKKTLYDRFGSKDRLIAAYLEQRNRTWHLFLDEQLAARNPATPEAVILALFAALTDWLAGVAQRVRIHQRERGAGRAGPSGDAGDRRSEAVDAGRVRGAGAGGGIRGCG